MIAIRTLNRLTKRVCRTVNYQIQKKIAESEITKKQKPYKLHIGCGSIRIDKWINIDQYPNKGVVDVVWDVTWPFPFDNDSCSLIYNEHFLEHLTVPQATLFLSESYRMLAPGGVLRIAMPSLDALVRKYCSVDWREQDWLTWPENRFIQTRAEMLNIALRWWGHQWVYDREELHRRLQEAGFIQIRDVAWGSSDVLELRNLERRKDSLLICEVQK
jgi:predicted SAM-dependent methyltransferase